VLVIGGTQRSGTSLMAQMLQHSGYDIDSEEGDEVGTGEHELTCGFFRDYLGDSQFPYDTRSWPQCSPEEFAALDLQVIKFAYLMMNPAFITIWHKFRPAGDTFLILNRDKGQVYKSKQVSWDWFQHDSPLLLQEPREMEYSFNACLGLLNQYGYNHIMLEFPRYIQDRAVVNWALAYLDTGIQISEDVWDSTIDFTRNHIR